MPNALLRVEELGKSYNAVRALEDVDIQVQRGEVLGLVGPNGSGKTTLFSCVTGFVRPSSGRIYWEGKEITTLAPDQIARRGVIRTFQQKMVSSHVGPREPRDGVATRRGGMREAFTCCGTSSRSWPGRRETSSRSTSFGSAASSVSGWRSPPHLLLLDEPAADWTPKKPASWES
jgi:ABC-type branched-subunit amino acid transport system ATPase component